LGVKIRQRGTDELHPGGGGKKRVRAQRLGRWAAHGAGRGCWLALTFSHATAEREALPRIGPAPEVSVTTQDGKRLSLKDLRGKVVAVTFIYISCADTCPLLTAKLAGLQARLDTAFGAKVFFVAITVDPERDTPQVLKRYAQARGVNLADWAFLTGTPAEI
jgi:protein SCO1